MSDLVLGVLGGAGVLLGLVGVLVPVVPGLVVVLAAAVATLAAQGALPWSVVVLLVVLAAVGSTASFVLPARRLAGSPVPRSSLLAAGFGAAVGFFVVPVLGLLIGAVAGLLVAEQQRTGDWSSAWVSSRGVLSAYGVGVLLELAAGVAMGSVWLVAFVVRA
jgi:hypothetical protein